MGNPGFHFPAACYANFTFRHCGGKSQARSSDQTRARSELMGEPPQQEAATKTYQAIPPLLLAEALGFSPQLLLDDIINIANDSIDDGVNGMEAFLEKWVEDRAVDHPGSENWDGNQEVEQGLVAFQTLLEFHTDMAFDYLEAWSLRNIFAVPFDLPIVLPHQQGLDLTVTPEQEQALMDEATELRAKIDEVRFATCVHDCRPTQRAATHSKAHPHQSTSRRRSA